MDQRSFNKPKVYVPVIVSFTTDGQMIPRSLVWEDSKRFVIDKVISRRPANNKYNWSQDAQYTVLISGRQKHLFFENGRWYVERK
jgi:hypothetical protein